MTLSFAFVLLSLVTSVCTNDINSNCEQTEPSSVNALDHPDLHTELPIAVFADCESEDVDILFAVVTPVEFIAVFRHLKPLPGRHVLKCIPDKFTYHVGRFGAYTVALVQQAVMGSGSAFGSQQVVNEALLFWNPKSVIMIGIAYGLLPSKQKLGDVLVSASLASTALKRVTGEAMDVQRRGSIAQSGPQLLPRFTTAETHDWQFSPTINPGARSAVHVGLVLSEDTLVDSKPNAEMLLREYPNAIGGEMEGAGLAAASAAFNTQWILVKGICDFAGLTGEKTKEAQPFAAAAAASLVKHVLSQQSIGPPKIRAQFTVPDAPVSTESHPAMIALHSGHVVIESAMRRGLVFDSLGTVTKDSTMPPFVHTWEYIKGVPQQQWQAFNWDDQDCFQLRSVFTGRCVDVAHYCGKWCTDPDPYQDGGGNERDTAPLVTWHCHLKDNQRFCAVPYDDGTVAIKAKHCGKAFDVAQGKTDNGTPLVVNPHRPDLLNQRFYVKPTTVDLLMSDH